MRHVASILPVLLLAAACAPRRVAEPSTWGELRAGARNVGFHAWVAFDSSRMGASAPRPVQISLWFPREGRSRGATLRWADYVGLGASESGGADSASDRRAAVEAFTAFLTANGVPAAPVSSWLASTMRASWERPAGDRALPLVLIAQGNGQAAYSQAVLAEYLASRGFAVVTTPSPFRTGATLESERDVYRVARLQAGDLAFAAREAVRSGTGSLARVAVVGHSFGARAALLLLGDHLTEELISLDGGIAMEGGKRWLDATPFVPGAVRGRITHLYETGDSLLRPDFDLLRALTGTARQLFLVPGLEHWQFTSFGTITAPYPELAPGRIAPGSTAGAAAVVRFVGCRLQAWAAGGECLATEGALVPQRVP